MNKFFIRKEAGWNPLEGYGRKLGDYLYDTFSFGPYKNGFDPRNNPAQYAQDIYDMSENRNRRLDARFDTIDGKEAKLRDIALNSRYVSDADRNYLDNLYDQGLGVLSQRLDNDIARHNIIGEPGSIRRAAVEDNIAMRRPLSYRPKGRKPIWANWEGLDQKRQNFRQNKTR